MSARKAERCQRRGDCVGNSSQICFLFVNWQREREAQGWEGMGTVTSEEVKPPPQGQRPQGGHSRGRAEGEGSRNSTARALSHTPYLFSSFCFFPFISKVQQRNCRSVIGRHSQDQGTLRRHATRAHSPARRSADAPSARPRQDESLSCAAGPRLPFSPVLVTAGSPRRWG